MLFRFRVSWSSWILVLGVLVADGILPEEMVGQITQDVVYLKDGSVIRGTIVEQIPGESILIETADGNRFRYLMDQIQRIAKETDPRGAAETTVNPPGQKSPGTAAVLSALIVGAGQGYNGEWGKAGLFFGGAVLLGGAAIEAYNADECYYNDECSAAGGYALGWIALAIWSIVDAHKSAKAINQRLSQVGLELLPGAGVQLRGSEPEWEGGVGLNLLRWVH